MWDIVGNFVLLEEERIKKKKGDVTKKQKNKTQRNQIYKTNF